MKRTKTCMYFIFIDENGNCHVLHFMILIFNQFHVMILIKNQNHEMQFVKISIFIHKNKIHACFWSKIHESHEMFFVFLCPGRWLAGNYALLIIWLDYSQFVFSYHERSMTCHKIKRIRDCEGQIHRLLYVVDMKYVIHVYDFDSLYFP
jgi:hypothetical protein